MRTNERDLSTIYLGMAAFFAGGTIATALTLLFALEGGRRTRESIRSFIGDAWYRTHGVARDISQQGRDLLAETAAALGAAYAAGREAFWREFTE